MRKIFSLFAMLLGTLFMSFAQSKPVVAVAPFSAVGDVSENDSIAVTELFTSQMVMNGRFQIVEHGNLNAVVNELRFQAKDWASDTGKVQAVGNAVNAQYVVRGQLMRLGSQYFLSTQVVKLQGFEILSASRQQFSKIEDVMSVLPKIVDSLAELMMPTPKAPSSPIIGVWQANSSRENCSCTIEFCEGNRLVVHSITWYQENSIWGMRQIQNPTASGEGNWEFEMDNEWLNLHIRLSSGQELWYRGAYSLKMGGTELSLHDRTNGGTGISIGRNSYERTNFFSFHKIR